MDKGLQGGKIMQGKFSDYLLVSDMDATLLDDNHTISEENRQAIDYFIKNGGRFTVATGRMVEAVRAYMPNLHINAPAVLHNGAKIYDYEKDCAVFERFIEENRKQAIKRVYDDFPQIGLEVYSDEIVYVYRECEETKRFLTRSYEVVYSLPDEIWQRPWIKVLLMLFQEQLQIMDFIEEVISVILLSMVKMEVSLMYLIGQQMEKHFISQTEQVYHTAKELSQRLTVHRQN